GGGGGAGLGGTGLGAAAAGGLSATATGRGAGLAGSDAAARAGFSGTGGFASSSAMIRRIDARISSMEGSWTFAGCVISDSTSATPSRAFYAKQFYTKRGQDLPVPDMQAGIFVAQA